MPTPIDATQTAAWGKLAQINHNLNVDFRSWFEQDAERTENSVSVQEIYSLIYLSQY